MLDCHDGVPVKPDLDDLITTAEAQKVVDVCVERGANLSLVYSDAHKSEDVGAGIRESIEVLKNIGFKNIYRFENRKPIAIEI